ncbi:MAG: hypothetical protein WCV81_02420 [Microgenomates group bacterium]|jgi:hypothetical protein
MSDLLGELLKTQRETKKIALEEEAQRQGGEEAWRFDNENLSQFESFFAPVLDKPLYETISEYKSSHPESTYVMNIMGGTQLLKELRPTKGIAVRLADNRTDQEKEEDTKRKISIITGKVLSNSLWKKIPSQQNFILSMPQGALYSLPISDDIYYFLINEMWKKLADNGTMLVQIPNFAKPILSKWTPALNQNSAINADYAPSKSRNLDYLAFKMNRLKGSPINLPQLPD